MPEPTTAQMRARELNFAIYSLKGIQRRLDSIVATLTKHSILPPRTHIIHDCTLIIEAIKDTQCPRVPDVTDVE